MMDQNKRDMIYGHEFPEFEKAAREEAKKYTGPEVGIPEFKVSIAAQVFILGDQLYEHGIELPKGWEWHVALPKKDWLALCRESKECQRYKHVPGLDDNVPDQTDKEVEEEYCITGVGIPTPAGIITVKRKFAFG